MTKCGRGTFYHVTFYDHLPRIRRDGLLPGGTCPTSTWGFTEHCFGRVFVAQPLAAGLKWYDHTGEIHGFAEAPALLRVRLTSKLTQSDRIGRKSIAGSRYVEGPVPRDCVEFWAPGEGWQPISKFSTKRYPKALAARRKIKAHRFTLPDGTRVHAPALTLYLTSRTRGGFKPDRGSSP